MRFIECGKLVSTGGLGFELPLILSKDGIYKGNLDISKEFVKDGKLNFPVEIKEVFGNFKCYDENLTSLEGCPELVTGDFDVFMNNLKNLIGCPKKVGGNFSCSDNKLKSFEGAPKKANKSFSCQNNKLINFFCCPERIEEDFICYHNNFQSLEGCPKFVGGNLYFYKSFDEKFFIESDIRAVCDVKGKVFV